MSTHPDKHNHKYDQSLCIARSIVGKHDKNFSVITNFEELVTKTDYVSAAFDLTIFAGCVYFIISNLCLKKNVSRFQWQQMISLALFCLFEGVAELDFFGLSLDDYYCDFADHIVYGCANIVFFNIALLIAFKLYSMTQIFF